MNNRSPRALVTPQQIKAQAVHRRPDGSQSLALIVVQLDRGAYQLVRVLRVRRGAPRFSGQHARFAWDAKRLNRTEPGASFWQSIIIK